ncbi:MAG TPA: UDP-glucose/GDP-mannose dehydrogenase family protein [Candidatus Parcubacteria bacterium]|nr:UDP-glucose/GDP-mannose dehydrogenase family protein [Candidatus Parcubacteria bacterium]
MDKFLDANKVKIGIIGVGMVGGALKKYFEKQGRELLLYDPGKKLGNLEEINLANVVFICVPTPFDKDKGFNLSYVEESCRNLNGEKIIVVKSTVIPGSIDALQEKHPQHKFLFNPEFLTEATAQKDMENPVRQILGYTRQSRSVAEIIMRLLPRAEFEEIIPAKAAEMVKYFSNTWYATKVIFANQMYELCEKIGVDYEIVRKCAAADKMIGPSHLDVRHKGYFGYGGKCLPKDIRALIEFADKNGVNLRLHKVVEEINSELIKKQGIKEEVINK